MSPGHRLQRFDEVAAARLSHLRFAIECVHHRHNVSAILRTADSVGLQHVHLVQSEPFEVSRGAARGAERWLDLHWHDNATEAITALHDAGFAVIVADLSDDPVSPFDLPVDKPLCVWMGAELVGVSDEARALADGVVTIPMHGFSQSLNVSVAAAITMTVLAERVRAQHGPAALLSDTERTELLALWHARENEADAALAARADVQV